MNRSTDLALHSLLPTHNGALPPQLVDLAGSLLAQSRQRASTLKADEDIARAYACAHLACDRLKTSLNLPPIEPRPPIPPRLYKRLYTHLGTVLQPAPSSRNKTPADRPEGQDTPKRKPGRPRTRIPGAVTPSRTRTPAKTPRTKAPVETPWLRPTLRFVCHDLGHARLAPTVAAGLSAIQREAALGKGADGSEGDAALPAWITTNQTALTAALCYYCTVSWRESSGEGAKPGKDAGEEERANKRYQADERAILGAFERARTDVHLEGGGAGKEDRGAWEDAGWTELTRRGFREALMVVEAQHWLQSDWFRDIQRLQEQDVDSDGAAADGNPDEDSEGAILPTHVWRADSMFQARYDVLSDARRQDYAVWREGILQQLSAAVPGEAMDVRV